MQEPVSSYDVFQHLNNGPTTVSTLASAFNRSYSWARRLLKQLEFLNVVSVSTLTRQHQYRLNPNLPNIRDKISTAMSFASSHVEPWKRQ